MRLSQVDPAGKIKTSVGNFSMGIRSEPSLALLFALSYTIFLFALAFGFDHSSLWAYQLRPSQVPSLSFEEGIFSFGWCLLSDQLARHVLFAKRSAAVSCSVSQ